MDPTKPGKPLTAPLTAKTEAQQAAQVDVPQRCRDALLDRDHLRSRSRRTSQKAGPSILPMVGLDWIRHEHKLKGIYIYIVDSRLQQYSFLYTYYVFFVYDVQ